MSIRSQISFFCGHDPECLYFEEPEALARAKANVERYYAVVGVLEQFDESIRVMEAYAPRFFANAPETYRELMRERHVNKNIYKPRTPDYVRRALAANFTLEIEFYEFCKHRLRQQMLAMS